MNSRHLFSIGGGLLLLSASGCSTTPCLDDGFAQDDPADCPADSAGSSETEDATGSDDSTAGDACGNGVQDGDETDVDCGGSCSSQCGSGGGCQNDDDCVSDACSRDNLCEDPSSCTNGTQDGDETDVDCGGSCETGCDDGGSCGVDTDCTSGSCQEDGTCGAGNLRCEDGERNDEETDVDCGGPDCDPCDDGGACMAPTDCASGICDEGVCTDASCRDGVQNGSESDLDCGGDTCAGCDDGGACTDGDDCASSSCVNEVCVAPSCDDGVRNADETGIDCGGDTCEPCGDGEGCGDGDDCASGVCTDELCQAPACDDTVQNGDETDVDCGGDTCEPCGPGGTCEDAGDCASAGCTDNVCNEQLMVSAGPLCGDASGGPVGLSAIAMGGTGGPYTYSWTPNDGTLDTPDQANTNADPAGFQTYTVTADDGANTATDTVVVLDSSPFNLQDNCTLYSADFGGMTSASIAYDTGGTRACENGNNGFGLHLCESVVFANTALTGRMEVSDNADDDDWIGLVWGAQDNAHFYSLAWKAGSQSTFGCTTPAGVLVKRIEADAFEDLDGADLYCPADTANSTVLALPAETTTAGWQEATAYDVRIEYTEAQSIVSITEVGEVTPLAEFTINDATFPSGAFGSTTTSQANACVGPLFGACLAD